MPGVPVRVGWLLIQIRSVNVCGPWALKATQKGVAPATRSILPSALQTLRGSQTCWAYQGLRLGMCSWLKAIALHEPCSGTWWWPSCRALYEGSWDTEVGLCPRNSCIWTLRKCFRFLPHGGEATVTALLWQDICQCHRNKECFSTLFMNLGEMHTHTHASKSNAAMYFKDPYD